ncbi:MAG: PAS domain S-box protein [Verrucomicrobiota bacterium]|nr:PAS domain S-box protein [Verrucomicrobiota bacterium]
MKTPEESTGRESDCLFESAFHYAAIGMALVAPDGKFLKVNQALSELTGYPEEELLKRTFQDITHPDDLAFDVANAEKLLSGEITTYQIEKRYFHKTERIVWVSLSVSLVREPDGAPRFFISQIQDITARKEGEQRLYEAAAEIKKLRQSLIKVCAWTKRIEVDGRWISVDDFLKDHLGLKLTHGISIEGARLLKEE